MNCRPIDILNGATFIQPIPKTMKKDPELTPEEELRIENELKALNLELTHGAMHFHSSKDLPPEILSAFLDNVTQFENANADGKTVPIQAFAKIESLPPTADLDEDEAERHIEALLEQLMGAGVAIDRPDHLNARGYYHFLRDVLLKHEIPDYQVPGMIHGFIYSEFVHDGPEFIEVHVEETLLDLLHLSSPFEGEWLSEHCRNQTEAISREEALASINGFRSKYSEIKPIAFRPEEIKQTHDGMYLLFLIKWSGTPADGGEEEAYEGLGVSQVDFEDGEWLVQGICMPGFEF